MGVPREGAPTILTADRSGASPHPGAGRPECLMFVTAYIAAAAWLAIHLFLALAALNNGQTLAALAAVVQGVLVAVALVLLVRLVQFAERISRDVTRLTARRRWTARPATDDDEVEEGTAWILEGGGAPGAWAVFAQHQDGPRDDWVRRTVPARDEDEARRIVEERGLKVHRVERIAED